MFVFVHISPIFSVLLTYSLKITSLLFWSTPVYNDSNAGYHCNISINLEIREDSVTELRAIHDSYKCSGSRREFARSVRVKLLLNCYAAAVLHSCRPAYAAISLVRHTNRPFGPQRRYTKRLIVQRSSAGRSRGQLRAGMGTAVSQAHWGGGKLLYPNRLFL